MGCAVELKSLMVARVITREKRSVVKGDERAARAMIRCLGAKA